MRETVRGGHRVLNGALTAELESNRIAELKTLIIDALLPQALVLPLPTLLMTAEACGPPGHVMSNSPVSILTVTLISDPPPHSCFAICLFTSHPIITKFYICHLIVSVNIF